MNKIITVDETGNILLGHLEVTNKDMLKIFRNYLMNMFKCYRSYDNVTLKGLLNDDFYCNFDQNCLVRNIITHSEKIDDDNIYVTYDSIEYYNRFINSILIFTSLLGELNIDNYHKNITKKFIKHGIFRYDSFDKIWSGCVLDILNLEHEINSIHSDRHSSDYVALKKVIDEGIVLYQIDQVISCEDSKKMSVFVGMNQDYLSEIMCNSEILGTNTRINRFLRRKK